MKKQIASVFVLVLFSISFPFVLVSAFLHGMVWGNFTFSYDKEMGKRAIETIWLKPCERIIVWGWKQRLATYYLSRE